MIFDLDDTYLPLPIEQRILDTALRLKTLGLPWTPHVGCFVWDREAIILAPSPFPKRVYFILSMPRFLNIFGSEANMQRRLVWVPTWHQAFQLCRRLGISVDKAGGMIDEQGITSGADALLRWYALIAQMLKVPTSNAPDADEGNTDAEVKGWISKVMQAEVGSLAHLPHAVQRRVQSAYDATGRAYLGWRRIQERRPEDWIPPETTFDDRLLKDMSHFYSDYQRVVQTMLKLREKVKRLLTVEPSESSDAFQRLVDDLLTEDNPYSRSGQIMSRLMDPQ